MAYASKIKRKSTTLPTSASVLCADSSVDVDSCNLMHSEIIGIQV